MNNWARTSELRWAAASVLAVIAMPASATIYKFNLSGTVQTVEGNASGSGISVGDAISGAFQFDDTTAAGPTLLPIGGGTYSIYSVPVTDLALAVGGYAVSFASYGATLTYMDDSFGSDGIVFGLDGLQGGPFGSTFANMQFQARGPSIAIDGSGLANGLPYNRFTPSFFAIFGNGATAERVFGSLTFSDTAAVPEPAAWLLMIGGLSVIGGTLRNRRKSWHIGAYIPA